MKSKKINMRNQKVRREIVDSLNISHLTKTQQDEIIGMLADMVADKVARELLKRLSKEDQKTLGKMYGRNSKKFLDFLNGKIENFSQLVEDCTRQTVNAFSQKRASM